jgi:hypothetical protein
MLDGSARIRPHLRFPRVHEFRTLVGVRHLQPPRMKFILSFMPAYVEMHLCMHSHVFAFSEVQSVDEQCWHLVRPVRCISVRAPVQSCRYCQLFCANGGLEFAGHDGSLHKQIPQRTRINVRNTETNDSQLRTKFHPVPVLTYR